jgi:hypothetical protein
MGGDKIDEKISVRRVAVPVEIQSEFFGQRIRKPMEYRLH